MFDDVTIAGWYVRKAESAKERGIEFTLSFKRYKELRNTKKCYYTGVELNREVFSLDRLDADKGYTDSNTVVCHRDFNHKKSNLTPADLKLILRAFKRKGIM